MKTLPPWVCILNLREALLQRPAGTFHVLAFCMQSGAGLYIGSGGEASLNGCQVYENQATVRAPVPGPSLQRPR